MKHISLIMLAAMLLALLGGCVWDPQPSIYDPIGEPEKETNTTPRPAETPRGESAEEEAAPETGTPPSSEPAPTSTDNTTPPESAPDSGSAATPPASDEPAATPPPADTPPAETPPTDTPASETPASADETPPTAETPTGPVTPILQTAELGVLVRANSVDYRMWPMAPESTRAPLSTDDRVSEPIIAGRFRPVTSYDPPGGDEYVVRVFYKREDESLEDWSKRSSVGDSFFPEERVTTRNRKSGVVYNGNDFGFGPVIHVMIPTDRFVYRIDWDDNRIRAREMTDEEFIAVIRRASEEEHFDSYYKPPHHFLNFIRTMEVQ